VEKDLLARADVPDQTIKARPNVAKKKAPVPVGAAAGGVAAGGVAAAAVAHDPKTSANPKLNSVPLASPGTPFSKTASRKPSSPTSPSSSWP
tara:strand:+ start:100 stop:375 length:276 start_codon:yes stop_codon:yes gene_type:complete